LEGFIHQILSGLATGGIYASLALALVMIYQSTHLVNFAQGEMAMFATYIAWSLITMAGFPYWAAFFATVAFAFVFGVVVERVIIRPVENASVLAVVVVFIALLVILNSVTGWIFTYTMKPFASPFPKELGLGVYMSPHEVGTILVTLVVLVLLYAFFRYTPLGLAMRAAAQNPESARLVGIRVGWMLALGWGFAAAIGAVAGMMVAPIVYLDPNMMGGVLLYAFAAALVGGIDNPGGAVFGGFLVGVLENVLGAYVIGHELKLAVALVIIVGVLTVKPSGFFGKVHVTRV
jgi:branched-chain amino acid transport system permease protein